MIVDCVADLHGSYPELQGGDLLIVAGDVTGFDRPHEWQRFGFWLNAQKYKHKVWIAGNHDGLIQLNREYAREFVSGAHYLQDDGIEIEGLKLWGSPWTPPFCKWHFMLPPEKIKEKWDLIPDDTDILITHGPALGTLDTITERQRELSRPLGCPHLRDAIRRVQPDLHVFGHIHGGYGIKSTYFPCGKLFTSVNAAHMNEDYRPVNPPIRVIL